MALDFRKRTVENGDSQKKSYLFPQVFVTNLQFDQVRFFFIHRCFHFFGTVNGVQFATETYRTGFQRKDQGEDGDYWRK